MKKKIVVIISIIIFICLIAISGYKLYESKQKKQKVPFYYSLEDYGYSIEIVDFQKGRSENLPYEIQPKIILINKEESFIFQFSNIESAKKAYLSTDDKFKKMTYMKDNYIIFYKGNNKVLEKTLSIVTKS